MAIWPAPVDCGARSIQHPVRQPDRSARGGRASVPTAGPAGVATLLRGRTPLVDYVGKCLGYDCGAHLARAHFAVGEDNGHFFDAEALAHALVDRCDLKSVALQVDGLQVKRLQHAAPVALESCGTVTHGQPQDRAREEVATPANDPPRR